MFDPRKTLRYARALFMPVEIWVMCFAFFTFSSFTILKVTFPHGILGLYLKQLAACVFLYTMLIVLGIFVESGAEWKRSRGSARGFDWQAMWRAHERNYVSRKAIFHDVRIVNSVVAMFVVFALMKHLIPHINTRLFDEPLAQLEYQLFGGRLLGELLHQSLGPQLWGMPTPALISDTYVWYYGFMNIALFLFVLQRNQRLTQEFICAFCLLFLVGCSFVYLLPSWGPCFFLPDRFQFIAGTTVATLQQDLWSMKLMLDQRQLEGSPMFLISGFPSLHLAVPMLSAIYLWRVSKTLSVLSWIFAIITLNSTLYLGWHYLFDDIGSVILVAITVPLARWSVGKSLVGR